MMNVQKLAREMREYIETHGWTQGTAMDRTGAVCLSGALARAARGADLALWKSDVREFHVAFCRATGKGVISYWNDAPERTYEEVILLLKQIEDGA